MPMLGTCLDREPDSRCLVYRCPAETLRHNQTGRELPLVLCPGSQWEWVPSVASQLGLSEVLCTVSVPSPWSMSLTRRQLLMEIPGIGLAALLKWLNQVAPNDTAKPGDSSLAPVCWPYWLRLASYSKINQTSSLPSASHSSSKTPTSFQGNVDVLTRAKSCTRESIKESHGD